MVAGRSAELLQLDAEHRDKEGAMKTLIALLFGFVAAAAALVPAITEAGMNMQHNETLVRDREAS